MPSVRIRLVFGDKGMIGPGKADLLERIRDTGSIAAAGRGMGMSYKRAWQLVETLNAMFSKPLVERTRGGAKGGGAQITATGMAVLSHYRAMHEGALRAGNTHIEALQTMLRDIPDGK